jgi:hypothetical protein
MVAGARMPSDVVVSAVRNWALPLLKAMVSDSGPVTLVSAYPTRYPAGSGALAPMAATLSK